MPPVSDHRRQAAALTRRISTHHQGCRDCQRGGQVRLTRHGLARQPCEAERALFTELEQAQEAGWPTPTRI